MSVMAPTYRKGRKPEWHFVMPGRNRAACGVVPSARIKGTKPVRSISCRKCAQPMWAWALGKTLDEMTKEIT